MYDDPRRSPGQDAVREVARPLAGSAREDDQVGRREGLIERHGELRLVVGDDPEPDGFAAFLSHRSGKDRRVRVVNRTEGERVAGFDDLVARGQDRDPGPADDFDSRQAERRKHANFARRDAVASPESELTARQVGPREGDALSRRDRLLDEDRAVKF